MLRKIFESTVKHISRIIILNCSLSLSGVKAIGAALPSSKDTTFIADNGVNLEDEYSRLNSRQNRLALLHGSPFSSPLSLSNLDFNYAAEISQKTIIYYRISTLIKMILLETPEEYNSDVAFQAIEPFEEADIATTVKQMRDLGSISKFGRTSSVNERRIPSRHFYFAERVATLLSGGLPYNFLEEVKSAVFSIQRKNLSNFMEKLDPGTIATILSLVSTNQISISISFPENDNTTRIEGIDILLLIELDAEFHLTLSKMPPGPASSSNRMKRSSQSITDDLDYDISFDKRLKGAMDETSDAAKIISSIDQQSDLDVEILQSIFLAIQEAGELGLNIIQLFEIVGESVKSDMRRLDQYLRGLMVVDIINCVGIRHHRYILHHHLEKWGFPAGGAISDLKTWKSLNGKKNNQAIISIKRSLFGYILLSPGITLVRKPNNVVAKS
jgi:hypothetical protein